MENNRGAIKQKPCGVNKGENENDDPSRRDEVFLNITDTDKGLHEVSSRTPKTRWVFL